KGIKNTIRRNNGSGLPFQRFGSRNVSSDFPFQRFQKTEVLLWTPILKKTEVRLQTPILKGWKSKCKFWTPISKVRVFGFGSLGSDSTWTSKIRILALNLTWTLKDFSFKFDLDFEGTVASESVARLLTDGGYNYLPLWLSQHPVIRV
ncbi:hypothetical protein C1645_841600, partial [Glomus cerebriforme]